MKSAILGLFLAPTLLYSLERKPWFADFLETRLVTEIEYNRYRYVDHAKEQFSSASNDKGVLVGLGMSPYMNWDCDVEIEFVNTPRQPFSYGNAAIQGRYLFLNDTIGDPVSLSAGVSVREVSARSVRDVSSPYHYYCNFELSGAIGKEWDRGPNWLYRSYAWGALGMANKGSPWARSYLAVECNIQDRHQIALFGDGYFGFGNQKEVDTYNFHGYASIHHQSVDLGISYKYRFPLWGSLLFSYERRVYAFSFPQDVNFFFLRYELPFSFF